MFSCLQNEETGSGDACHASTIWILAILFVICLLITTCLLWQGTCFFIYICLGDILRVQVKLFYRHVIKGRSRPVSSNNNPINIKFCNI